MLADFFTKPLQGSTFKRMRSIILNMHDTDNTSIEHRSVLGNKKITEECRENQNAASTKTRTLKARKRLKNDGNKIKPKISKNNKNGRKGELFVKSMKLVIIF